MGANKNKIDASQGVVNKIGENVWSNFDGILSIKPIAKYFSGARCTLKMNGRIIGFAFSITWEVRTEVTPINTIDNYESYELAPRRVEVHGSIGAFRIPGSGPGNLLLQPDVLNFLHQKYVEIEVRDSQSDNILFYTSKAMITSRNENVRTDDLSRMSLEFVAIGFLDDRDPTKPIDISSSSQISGIGGGKLSKFINNFL